MNRPAGLFGRQQEWADLVRLVESPEPKLKLGLLYGRRRFGKSFLLRRLVDSVGGLYHLAIEQERRPALERFAETVARLVTPVPPVALDDWETGFRFLLTVIGEQRGDHVVVLDEYPYLRAASPEIDSTIQAVMDDVAGGGFGSDWRGTITLILCGSAMSVMTDLLSGTAPLRGRATFDLSLRAFDYREFREYWNIADPVVAFQLNAVLGGAPGYRTLTAGVTTPQSPDDVPAWLAATVLAPSHALYSEDRYLLREDPRITKHSLYYSMLNAIAGGATAPSEIAQRIGKKVTDLDHSLGVLRSAGFITRHDDLMAQRRPNYQVSDPIVRFHELITRRNEDLIEEREVEELWQRARPVFSSQIIGPHFEHICREWVTRYASVATLGGEVGPSRNLQINDKDRKQNLELDVVAATRASASGQRKVIQLLGEAKGSRQRRDLSDLVRLDRSRELLEERGVAMAGSMRLVLFGLSGFSPELEMHAAERADVELVDIDRLYGGD